MDGISPDLDFRDEPGAREAGLGEAHLLHVRLLRLLQPSLSIMVPFGTKGKVSNGAGGRELLLPLPGRELDPVAGPQGDAEERGGLGREVEEA